MIEKFVTCFSLIVIIAFATGCDNLAILSPEEKTRAFYRNINLSHQGNEKSFYTFLTYNIHMGFNSGQDFQDPDDIGATQKHLLRLVESIQSVDADFVALQEVADDRSNTEIKNQLEFLAKKLNMNYAYGVDGEGKPVKKGVRKLFATGREGNAILSKHKITSVENAILIHRMGKWRAGGMKLDIEISDNTSITIVNTHLTPSPDSLEVNLQIKNVLEFATNQTLPTVIMGDFNKLPESVHIKRITERFPDTCAQIQNENSDFVKRYGTWLPDGFFPIRIDYIFIQPDIFKVIDVGLLSQEYWGLSDHVGYYAKVKF